MQSANKFELVEIWKKIKTDHHKHVDLLKNVLDKEFHQ